MKCARVQELLLTDYADSEIKGKKQKRLERHLAECPECHAVYNDVRKLTVEPFRKGGHKKPSEAIWDRIKERTAGTEKGAVKFRDAAGGRCPRSACFFGREALRILWGGKGRPASIIVITAAVMLAVFVFALRTGGGKAPIDRYISRQTDFLLALKGDGSDIFNGEFSI